MIRKFIPRKVMLYLSFFRRVGVGKSVLNFITQRVFRINAQVKTPVHFTSIFVGNNLHYDIEYPNVFMESTVKSTGIGVTMTRKVKQIGCSTLKELMEENKLRVIDKFTINELVTFVGKGISYEADGGNHDDLVMNLVLFSWFVTTPFFQSLTDLELKKMLYDEQQQMIEDDMVPFGIIDDGSKVEQTYSEGGDVWTVVDDVNIY